MINNKPRSADNKMYTHHGEKRNQGELCKVNGAYALAYMEKDKVVGFTTLDEIMHDAYSNKVREYTIEL